MTEVGARPPSRTANVIVVMYNSQSTLQSLFDGLEVNRPGIASVTLVDNGSTDSSAQLARNLLVETRLNGRVLVAENTGFAGGHWEARNSFEDPSLPTLCLNPDVKLDADALPDMIDVLLGLGTGAGIVTSTLVSKEGVEDSASRRRLPTLTTGALYSVLGKLVPEKFRYNMVEPAPDVEIVAGHVTTRLEATTGALMLVAPQFRSVQSGIFDRDYFMYGEDLQLCLEAQRANLAVAIVERRASIHIKGVSSGFPRSWKSNRAFHDALYLYYRKNLSVSLIDRGLVRAAVWGRLMVSSATGAIARARAKPTR